MGLFWGQNEDWRNKVERCKNVNSFDRGTKNMTLTLVFFLQWKYSNWLPRVVKLQKKKKSRRLSENNALNRPLDLGLFFTQSKHMASGGLEYSCVTMDMDFCFVCFWFLEVFLNILKVMWVLNDMRESKKLGRCSQWLWSLLCHGHSVKNKVI